MNYKHSKKIKLFLDFFKSFKIKDILILGFIFSSFFTVQLCAKYVSNTQPSGVVDSARVAKYDVSVEGESEKTLNIDCSSNSTLSASYPFSVTNNSEVVVKYTISVTLTGQKSVPGGITLYLDGEEGNVDGNKVTFATPSVLGIGQGKKEHRLEFTATPESISGDITISNIAINADIVQVD